MKKVLFLSVLLGLMALPMFASDISFGGDLTYGAIFDLDDETSESTTATFDIKAAIDDFNSLKIELNLLKVGDDSHVDKAYCTTDIGTWLSLPMGLKLEWGKIDPGANRFMGVSGYGNEKIYDFSPGNHWGVCLLSTINFIEIKLAVDGVEGRLLAGIAAKEPVAGLNAELFYFQGKDPEYDVFDQGSIGVSANYSKEISGVALKVGAGLEYSLVEDANIDYGVGLKVGYSIATLTVGLDGFFAADSDASEPLNGLTATVWVDAIDMLSIYAGLKTLLSDDDNPMRGVDLGLNIHMGKCQLYVGYLVTEVEDGKWKAPANIAEGGAYVKLDIDY